MQETSLMQALFANDKLINNSLTNITVLPNIMGGLDIQSNNGEVLASAIPDVLGDGMTVMSDGERIAHISENVMGGSTIDMGMGEFINSRPNILGGENFSSSMEGDIGFSKPNFDGGFDLFSDNGDMLLSTSSNIFQGLDVSTPLPVDVPGIADYSGELSGHLESIDIVGTFLNTTDVSSALDILDVASDGFGILSWFG